MILAHRLLKAPIEHKKHVLVTESMHTLIGDQDGKAPEVRTELRMFGKVEWHLLKRLVVPASKRYQKLEASQLK